MRILFVFLCLSAQAATYYVQKTGSSDSNGCTVGAPCLTITRAAAVATSAGDVVQVGAGTYAERVTLTTSGSLGSPITFRGHSGTCPSSINADPLSRGYRPAPTVTMQGFVVTASYINLECFTVSGSATPAFDIGQGRTTIAITDNVADATATPGSPTVGINMPYVAPASMPSNVTFSRNYIIGTIYGGVIYCQTGCIFDSNELTGMKAVADGNDNDYFRFFGENITFNNNYMHGSSLSDCIGDCHIDCFQTWNVANNSFELAHNITISNNTCRNADQGVISRDIANGTSAGTISTHRDYYIFNNTFAKGPLGTNATSPAGRVMGLCGAFDHTGGIVFVNNVCDVGYSIFGDSSDVVYKNNLHYNGGAYPYSATVSGSVYGVMTSDKNLLYDGGRTYSGWSGDVINQNPLLVDPTNGNYRISAGSPAIGAGANLSSLGITALNSDKNGVARGASWDIGAFQHGQPTTFRGVMRGGQIK